MKYVITFTLRTLRNPVELVNSALIPLIRNHETVETTCLSELTTHSVTVNLKLHKTVYHPSDWVIEAVESVLSESESATDWDFVQIKPEDV